MSAQRARAAAAPVAVFGAWLLLVAWWTHGFQAFTSFSAARVAAGPLPRASPPLRVVDQDAARWDVASPSTRYRLVQAMYLRCPDICPVTMARLGLLTRDLADLVPGRLQIVSLDVDGDAPGALRAMWTAHGSRVGWTMASLTDAPVEPIAQRLGVWMRRRPDGLIDHGLELILLDRNGDVVDIIPPEEDEAVTVDRLRRAIR